MSSIDERIVRMRFDGGQFESGISRARSVLDGLKKALHLDGASRGLAEVNAQAGRVNFDGMSNGLQNVSAKFSAMQAVGVAALATVASKATSAGMEMAKAFTIDPIIDGFREYETQMGAIQTILANTSHQGSTLKDVNGALGELNTYSDKTIYNFTEMAKNIGTFTAAGVDLDTSTSAIKGIANLAAVSGSNSQQASTAMYQLSQALAAGKVGLQDWNSVVNAGMGGKVFQDALLQTAKVHGQSVDDIIKGETSFRDSMKSGWLTSEVLTETLSKFTGDLNAQQLKSMGYNEEQIKGIMKMAKTAQDAATKVKTVTQLVDTLKEAAGSGWAKTWQLLFGDFEEAKELFTNISDTLGPIIQKSADARNNLIKGWSDLGGRTAAIEAVSNVFKALMSVLKPIGQAFRDIFPPTTAKTLYDITVAVRDFTRGLSLSSESSDKVRRTFRGLFAVLDIGWSVIKGVVGVLARLFGVAAGGAGSFLDITAAIGDFLVKIRDVVKNSGLLKGIFSGLEAVLRIPIELIKILAKAIGSVFDGFEGVSFDGLESALGRLSDRFGGLGEVLGKVGDWVSDAFGSLIDFVAPAIQGLVEECQKLVPKIIEALSSGNFDQVMDVLNTGIFAAIALAIRKFLKGFGDVKDGGGFLDHITGSFDALTGVLEGMQTRIKARALIEIAAALAIMTASVVALSLVDSKKLMAAVGAIGAMAGELVGAMAGLNALVGFAGAAKLPFIAGAMILLATAVGILAIAVAKLSDLDWPGLIKGLVGVSGIMAALVVTATALSKNSGGMIRGAAGLILIATAVRILVKAVEAFSDLSWEELIRGLVGVGAVLTALAIFTKLNAVSKGGMVQAAGILVLAAALKVIAGVVSTFASMDTGSLIKGLAAITGVLTVLTIFTKVAGNGGGKILLTAIALTVLAGAISILVGSVVTLGDLDWETLGRGLAGMAGALLIVAAAMLIMPPNLLLTAAGMVGVAAALVILSTALQTMAGMTWDEIGRGLTVLAGSLLILAGAMIVMSGTVAGSLALMIAVGALTLLTPVLMALGLMSWEMILKGLVGLAGALAVIGVAGVLLTPVVPTLIGLGVALGLIGLSVGIAAAGLALLATALTGLIVAVAAVAGTLIGVIRGLLDLIPYAFTKVGEAIVALAGVIKDGAPAIGDAVLAVLQTILNTIQTISPQIVDTLVNLVRLMVGALVDNIPWLVEAGYSLLLGVLNGIRSHITEIVNVVSDIIVSFLNALSANLPRITEAGANLIVTFVRSCAQAVRNNSAAMRSAGLDLAMAIADGMSGGLASRVGELAGKAASMAKGALSAAKSVLGIHSPSKEFFKVGSWSGEGMIKGLDAMQAPVARSSAAVAKTALSSVKNVLGNLSDQIDTDIEISPVIKPVLDLTRVQSESGRIGELMSAPKINPKTTYGRASALSNMAVDLKEDDISKAKNESPQPIQFNQYNNSPKALSAIEIYRQTRNQLSSIRGVK